MNNREGINQYLAIFNALVYFNYRFRFDDRIWVNVRSN